MSITDIERDKYAELWSDVPEYREYSPGLENVERFLQVMQPRARASLIDIGCGTGQAGLKFAEFGFEVSWIDITAAGLHPDVPRQRFIEQELWGGWARRQWLGYDYGFCCDVMEHVPTEYTMLALDRIISVCRTTWFQIALVPDQFGLVIDQPLHLTVRPFRWWLDHLRTLGRVLDARDLCGSALYVVGKP
jgi:SAM-dependent methyltransferase